MRHKSESDKNRIRHTLFSRKSVFIYTKYIKIVSDFIRFRLKSVGGWGELSGRISRLYVVSQKKIGMADAHNFPIWRYVVDAKRSLYFASLKYIPHIYI